MAIELEGLEFQIEARSDSAAKGIDSLIDSLSRLKTATKGGLGLSSSVKQLQSLDEALGKIKNLNKLNGLGNALSSLDKIGGIKISGTIPKRINDIVTAAGGITPETIANLNMLRDALSGLGSVGNARIPSLQQTGQSIPSVSPSGTAPTVPQDSGTVHVNSQIQQVTQSSLNLRSILSGLGGVFRKSFKTGAGGLKSLVKGASQATTGFLKLASVIPRKAFSQLIGKVRQTTSSLGHFLSSLKRIAMYRAVRAVISTITKGFSEGIGNLYQYSAAIDGTFSKSMDKLATSSQYLKNSLGAMTEPIINALAPAVDLIVDKFVTLINYVNQLFSKLSGSETYTAAKKVSKTWTDAAKQTTEEIKRFVLGFDELNVLGEKDKTSDKKADTDYSSMFEQLPVENAVGDFAERLKKAFLSGDWEGLGKLLGGKVNEIFDSINWTETGANLGRGFDGAIKTIYYTLDGIDFKGIGGHLAELLNGAMSTTDFSFVGRLTVKPFTSLASMIIGFIKTLNWKSVGKSISDYVKGVFDECSHWLDSVDWVDFGQSLWDAIYNTVTNIDYGGIAKSLFTLLGKAIRALVQMKVGFYFNIAQTIKNWWDKDIQGANFLETASNLLNAIAKGFADIGSWIFDNIIKPFSEALLGESWDDITEVGKNLMDGMCKGITDFFVNIGTWLSDNIFYPFIDGIKSLFGIHSPSTVMEEIGGYVSEGLLNGIAAPFKAIGTWVKDNILTPIKDALKNAGLVLEAGVKLVKQGWSTIGSWVGNTVSVGVSLWKSGWSSIASWIGNSVTVSVSLVKDGWDTIGSWITGATNGVDQNIFGNNKTGGGGQNSGSHRADGGIITASGIRDWTRIPGYAGGSANVRHGTMFVAGEAGPEIVGHVGGRTEVLNQSQLAAVMTGAVSRGMMRYLSYITGIENKMVQCTNAVISSVLTTAEAVRRNTSAPSSGFNTKDINDSVGMTGNHTASLCGDNTDQIAEGVRQGMYEGTAQQNDLLREQNDLLRQLLSKDTTVEITTNSFTKAINRKNQRDGKTVIPVSKG